MAPEEERKMTDKATPDGPRTHRVAVPLLLVIGTLVAVLASSAVWINRQVMDTDNWTNTSSQLLEDTAIRGAVSGYLVDQLYANVDVAGQIQSALPTQAKPLAAPAAGALRNLAEEVTDKLLQRPRVQTLWENANRAAHTVFLRIVKGGGNVTSENGQVTLDLRGILEQLAARTGVGSKLVAKIPEGAAQMTIMKSDQLGVAQDIARILRPLAILLLAIAFGLWAIAVWIAGPRRREALRGVGFGFVATGAIVLIIRALAGDAVVNALATTEAVRPAAESVWSIGTSMLVEVATAAILYGIVFVLAAWLGGPSSAAVSCRRGLAPYLRQPRYAWGGLAVLVLLLVLWSPTPATRSFVPLMLLIGLMALGIETLRRQTAREYPEAAPALADGLRSGYERLRGLRKPAEGTAANGGPAPAPVAAVAVAPAAPPAPPEDEITRLERLAGLHDRGVLTDEEFAERKQAILAGS